MLLLLLLPAAALNTCVYGAVNIIVRQQLRTLFGVFSKFCAPAKRKNYSAGKWYAWNNRDQTSVSLRDQPSETARLLFQVNRLSHASPHYSPPSTPVLRNPPRVDNILNFKIHSTTVRPIFFPTLCVCLFFRGRRFCAFKARSVCCFYFELIKKNQRFFFLIIHYYLSHEK